ncbi:MAG: hypothetical protein LCH81_10265 [Bacteroidetes bacterium]|nr:hypothetical protein [Bacteroidota bacterium]
MTIRMLYPTVGLAPVQQLPSTVQAVVWALARRDSAIHGALHKNYE